MSYQIPAREDLEKHILGAAIESPSVYAALVDAGMNEGDFSCSDYRRLCSLLAGMTAKSLPIDILSVAHELNKKDCIYWLSDLCYGSVLSIPHHLNYLRILKEVAATRHEYHSLIAQAEALLDVSDSQTFEIRVENAEKNWPVAQ